MTRTATFLAAALALGAPPALAGPIVTDRPDVAESSLVVGAGAYQLEQAVQLERGPGAATYFPSLHRLGLGDGLELRLESPLVNLAGGRAALGEAAFGAKWHVLDGGEPGGLPSVALLGHLAFDGGSGIEPIGKVLIDVGLPAGFDLGLNLGASRPLDGGFVLTGAGAVSHEVVGPLRAYAELSGEGGFAGGPRTIGVDGGFAWLLSDDLQLDLAAYRGLTPDAPGWYLTSGLSARFGAR